MRSVVRFKRQIIQLWVAVALAVAACDGPPRQRDFPEAAWHGRTGTGGFTHGRSGASINLIILYTTEHSAERALKLWRESESVSGHYVVSQQGKVWQVLRDADAGWHAGNREFNLRSIAIAVEGFADPLNPENPSRDSTWQTNEQLEALAGLIQWLCVRYQIPVDRAHIIGKNQVPGVRTLEYSQSGPQYWGGAGNKCSPGATWNWGRLMEKLGRKPVYQSLVTETNCAVTTLPGSDAPILFVVKAGMQLEAYDRHTGYWLVFATQESLPQPYLPAGRYHWDGWVDERLVTAAVGGSGNSSTTNKSPNRWKHVND